MRARLLPPGRTYEQKELPRRLEWATLMPTKLKLLKKSWNFEKILYYSFKVDKCPSTTGKVYSHIENSFAIFLREDPTCAIANIYNTNQEPLRSPAEFNFASHGTFQEYFTVDEETDWQFDDGIKANKPRSFLGSFILLSNLNTVDLLKFCRVDLHKQCKGNGSIGIKEIQELHTVKGFILMGVHGSTYAPEVATQLPPSLD